MKAPRFLTSWLSKDPLEKMAFTEPSPRQLTEKEFIDTLWYSFMFSQGDFELQFALLKNIHARIGAQTHLDRNKLFDAVSERMLSKKTVTPRLKVTEAGLHLETPPELIEIELSREERNHNLLGAMIDALYKGDYDFHVTFTVDGEERAGRYTEKSTNASVENIFELMTLIDYKWLVYYDGRRDRDEKNIGKGDLSDKYFSFVWSYLEDTKKIKNTEFQELYETLRKRWPAYKNRMKRARLVQFSEISRVYRQYHPEQGS